MSDEWERGAALLDMLGDARMSDIKAEVRRLREIEKWAIASLKLGYGVGDSVRVVEPIVCHGGWAGFDECLAVGTTGTVRDIRLSPSSGTWYATYVPDRIWRVWTGHDGTVKRTWRWPGTDAPEGMEPYPGGPKRSSFMLATSRLGPIAEATP